MLKTIISALMVAFIFTAFISISNAEEELDAKKIYEDNKCQLCHSIESQGIEAKKKNDAYPDLSKLSGEYEVDFLKAYLMKKEKINSKNHPMNFKGSDEELTALVNWFIALDKESKEAQGE